MNYLLFNEHSDAGQGLDNAERVASSLEAKGFPIEAKVSLIGLNLKEFFLPLKKEDAVVIVGGDGTLNHFINVLGDTKTECAIYLYPWGTGTDFYHDLPDDVKDPNLGIARIDPYLERLPIAEIDGKKYRFLNGVGFGIDGDTCVKAEEMKAAGEKVINYGNITLGLLLGPYVAPTATVVIDGKEPMTFKRTYLASSMNGRYYGGGIMIAPDQARNSGKLSFVCIHGRRKLRALLILPKIFKGAHTKVKKAVHIETARSIEVTFDRPCGLQIDGEVLVGVTSYKAYIPE